VSELMMKLFLVITNLALRNRCMQRTHPCERTYERNAKWRIILLPQSSACMPRLRYQTDNRLIVPCDDVTISRALHVRYLTTRRVVAPWSRLCEEERVMTARYKILRAKTIEINNVAADGREADKCDGDTRKNNRPRK
jgi:hypothetical protein